MRKADKVWYSVRSVSSASYPAKGECMVLMNDDQGPDTGGGGGQD